MGLIKGIDLGGLTLAELTHELKVRERQASWLATVGYPKGTWERYYNEGAAALRDALAPQPNGGAS